MNSKKWYLSKAIWAGIVTALLGLYDSAIGIFASQCGVAGAFCLHLPVVPPLVITALGFLGLYGRSVADTKIVWK